MLAKCGSHIVDRSRPRQYSVRWSPDVGISVDAVDRAPLRSTVHPFVPGLPAINITKKVDKYYRKKERKKVFLFRIKPHITNGNTHIMYYNDA